MADAKQSIPDIYREAAEEVRQLALRARLTDIRGDLLELSARFETSGSLRGRCNPPRRARLSSR